MCVDCSRRKKIAPIQKFTYAVNLNYICISCPFPLVPSNTTGSSQGWEHAGFPKQEEKIMSDVLCPFIYLYSFFSFFVVRVGEVTEFYQKLPL